MRPGILRLVVVFSTALIFTACGGDKSDSYQTYDTLKAWHEAIKNQDYKAYRNAVVDYQFMPNGQRVSANETIYRAGMENENVRKMHETDGIKLRNERITRDDSLNIDIAVIEWQDATGNWRRLRLIREKDMGWKVHGFF